MTLTTSMGIKETHTGLICRAETVNMPFNLGTVFWDGMDCLRMLTQASSTLV